MKVHYFLSCSERNQNEPTTSDTSKVTCRTCRDWTVRFSGETPNVRRNR